MGLGDKNLIALKQIRTGQLYTFVTGAINPILVSSISGLSGFLSNLITGGTYATYTQLTGASGALQTQISNTGSNLQAQINALNLTGGTSSVRSARFNIPNGVDFIACPYGVTSTGMPTYSIGGSGVTDPIFAHRITSGSNTGIYITFSEFTTSANYYANIHF